MRILAYIVGVLIVVYALLVAGLAYAMHQPPETFGQVMGKVPRAMMPALFPILPFKPIWTWARAGTLQEGDPAPDFSLGTTDKSRRVQLSSFRGARPVVLVFGSYT